MTREQIAEAYSFYLTKFTCSYEAAAILTLTELLSLSAKEMLNEHDTDPAQAPPPAS